MALISVVIPTCHRNDLLAKCLDCLAPGIQTLDADLYEVIVTDDGSTSTAEEMVKASYPWAKWTQGPRKGPAANRNHGATLAQGKWIAFTDDDCLPDPSWLEAYIDEQNKKIDVLEGKTISRDMPCSPFFEAPLNECGGYLWSCNFAIRNTLFKELDGFDERFPVAACEDVDLRKRITLADHNIRFVAKAIVNHPARPIRSLQQRRRMHVAEVILAVKHNEEFNLKGRIMRSLLKTGIREIRKKTFSIQSWQWAFEHALEAFYVHRDYATFIETAKAVLSKDLTVLDTNP